MKGERIDFAIKSAVRLIEMLEDHDSIADITFSHIITVVSEFIVGTEKINSFEASGGTSMLQAFKEAFGLLQNVKYIKKEIILLSDGEVGDSEAVYKIVSFQRKSGVVVSTVGLGANFDEQMMQNISQCGGGTYYYATSGKDLQNIFTRKLENTKFSNITSNTEAFFIYDKTYVSNIKLSGFDTHITPLEDFSKIEKERIEFGNGDISNIGGINIQLKDFSSNDFRRIFVELDINVKDFCEKANKEGNLLIMPLGKIIICYLRMDAMNYWEEEKRTRNINIVINKC
jgi:uncharacterized protein YegL